MPFFSISLEKPARVPEPKSTMDIGELAPTSGRAVELRVDLDAYNFFDTSEVSPVAFWADLARLLQRIQERAEPRPERAVSAEGGEPWADGTFWSDGTGWVE